VDGATDHNPIKEIPMVNFVNDLVNDLVANKLRPRAAKALARELARFMSMSAEADMDDAFGASGLVSYLGHLLHGRGGSVGIGAVRAWKRECLRVEELYHPERFAQ
jgi:hypothetical protein